MTIGNMNISSLLSFHFTLARDVYDFSLYVSTALGGGDTNFGFNPCLYTPMLFQLG